MAAHLYNDVLIGPIHSRRLGTSLGINLLPTTTKFCTFECIYCECGNTPQNAVGKFADPKVVHSRLEKELEQLKDEGKQLDSITFSGNGEPTMHPDFATIIDDVILLRDKYFPNCQISVLSNATQLHHPNVVKALKKVDNKILKIDAGTNETAITIDQPLPAHYNINDVAEQFLQFNGDFTMQTIFIRGTVNGKIVDNTTPTEIAAWFKIVEKTQPKQVMVYSLDRDTPIDTLQKVSKAEMEAIVKPLQDKGFYVTVAG